jgi:hypothetical protein
MKQADEIREFVYREYIKPARERSQPKITIRAGDVHDKIGLSGRLPTVCSAIGTKIFERKFGVKCIDRKGVTNGADVYFIFLMESIV